LPSIADTHLPATQAAPAAALFEAQKAVSLWAPTFDRVELPEDPLKMAEAGQFSNNVRRLTRTGATGARATTP
jgi:hypothetical protein